MKTTLAHSAVDYLEKSIEILNTLLSYTSNSWLKESLILADEAIVGIKEYIDDEKDNVIRLPGL